MIKTIQLNNIDNNQTGFDPETKNNEIICNETYTNLIRYKNMINELNNNKIWDKAKKLSNDYELIYLPNKKNKKDSIALYEPLSRSYFKMWEMLIDFKLIEDLNKLKILCLAEGPGGFLEAINNYRKKYIINDINDINDNIYAITLKSTNKDIPGWKESKIFLNKNSNITISYGEDNTGNLYNIKNIKYLLKLIPEKNDLITADGGFDFSLDFNNQEKLSYKIIFCEIVSALYNQKIGGHFVCKIYDIYTIITIRILYLLNIHYKEIYITKPHTSRPANSEKYIICKYFKGIENSLINKLLMYIENWDQYNNDEFLNFLNIPNYFYNKIQNYNEYITNKQIDNIKYTLEIIDNEENLNNLSKIIKNQINIASTWCKKYNIVINTESNYLYY